MRIYMVEFFIFITGINGEVLLLWISEFLTRFQQLSNLNPSSDRV